MPLIQGSSVPIAKVVAMTASTQSPPAASTAAPTSAARRDWAATMPPFDWTAGLRICWELENWSAMGFPCLLLLFWRAAPPRILAWHILQDLAGEGGRTLLDEGLHAFADVGVAAALDRHRLVDIKELERIGRAGKAPQHLAGQGNGDRRGLGCHL